MYLHLDVSCECLVLPRYSFAAIHSSYRETYVRRIPAGLLNWKPKGSNHQALCQCHSLLLVLVPDWEFPKIRGTLFWGPYNKHPTISGAVLGSPNFGNSH